MMTTILVGCAMLWTACNKPTPQPQPPAHQPQEAATRALDTLKGLVTEQNYKAMGFESADEVKSAALADPLPVSRIQLDQLRAYQPGSDPSKLMMDVGQMMYPVTAREQVRSSIVVVKDGDAWKEAKFGGPAAIKAITSARAKDQGEGKASGPYTLVQVPALNMYFLARQADGKWMFVPAIDDPANNFRAGVAVPAEEALRALSTAAQKYNGLPE
jgi:hypothetical protein